MEEYFDQDNPGIIADLLRDGADFDEVLGNAVCSNAVNCVDALLEVKPKEPIWAGILESALPSVGFDCPEKMARSEKIFRALVERGGFSTEDLEETLLSASSLLLPEYEDILIQAGARPRICEVGILIGSIFGGDKLAAFVQAKNIDPDTPLVEAALARACQEHPDVAHLLLARGVKPKGKHGEWAVRASLRAENKTLFQLLRNAGANTECLPEELACQAAKKNDYELLVLNLSLCRDVRETATTCLCSAAETLSASMVQTLCSYGADPSAFLGMALRKAAGAGNLDGLKALISNGTSSEKEITNALWNAAEKDRLECAKCLYVACKPKLEDIRQLTKLWKTLGKENETTIWIAKQH